MDKDGTQETQEDVRPHLDEMEEDSDVEERRRDEKEMSFLDHLEELRWRIIWSIVAAAAGAILCYFFSEQLLAVLTQPTKSESLGIELITLRPIGMFIVRLNISLIGGIVITSPFVLYQIWLFVAPGLFEREKRYIPGIIIPSIFCFAIGALVAYFWVLPIALRFMAGLATEYVKNQYNINDYISFVLRLVVAFGVVFELPVLSFILSKIGILTPGFLRRIRKYAIVAIVTLAAIITPPDPLSQVMMAGPLIVLYEISVLISKFASKDLS